MENNNLQTFEDTIVRNRWNSCPPYLDIHLPDTKSSRLSKEDIRKDIISNFKPSLFFLIMSICFCVSQLFSLILLLSPVGKDADLVFWIVFVGVFGLVGISFMLIFIKTYKNSKNRINAIPDEFCFKIITCTEKEYDNAGEFTDYYIMVDYKITYHISQSGYNALKIGDELALIQIKDSLIAYPLKLWTLEGVND